MNVFNCHVNRTPLTGKIEDISYKPGKFLNDFFRLKQARRMKELF